MQKENRRVILALGLFSPNINGKAVYRGMKGVIAAARKNFPNKSDKIITIRSLTDFEDDFKTLTEEEIDEQADGKFHGIASGFFVQEALEGGHDVTDIHYDLTGIQNVKDPTHASSELRSLIAHIRAFHPRKVNIHFAHEKGLSSLFKDADYLTDTPLPYWLQKHILISIFTES